MAWRHDFHTHPELGFNEVRTAARVAELLQSWGIEVHRNIGRTGVVGVLRRGAGSASIGLRADMDALPITELNDFAHASQKSGVMHACGHDGHTSMLLGAAQHLAQHGDFDGTVVFIFQPNEEHGEGAPAMIADGLFDRFSVDQVFAIHNMPGMETGTIAMRAGPMTASESLFEITINARGAHAALPHGGGCHRGGGAGRECLANDRVAQAEPRFERRGVGDRIHHRRAAQCLAGPCSPKR